MMKRHLLLISGALVLTGCLSLPPGPVRPPATVKPATPEPPVEQPPLTDTVPPFPKTQLIDWRTGLQPLVAKMVNVNSVKMGSVLLLDSVKNNTYRSLQTAKATAALQALLAAENKFTLVAAAQLATAKQALGLSDSDRLGSRSKAIGLARYVNAQYVLYSTLSGDVNMPTIDMQLMLVQTGEIIWSGRGVIGQ